MRKLGMAGKAESAAGSPRAAGERSGRARAASLETPTRSRARSEPQASVVDERPGPALVRDGLRARLPARARLLPRRARAAAPLRRRQFRLRIVRDARSRVHDREGRRERPGAARARRSPHGHRIRSGRPHQDLRGVARARRRLPAAAHEAALGWHRRAARRSGRQSADRRYVPRGSGRVTIRSEDELAGMRHAGAVVRDVLRALERALEPGVTTGELERSCAQALARRGAEPTPARVLGFPGSLCISVNDEAVHGVPGARRVEGGDLVKLDLVATLDGFVADAAVTVCVPPVPAAARALARTARSALATAISSVRAGLPLRALGRAIERTVRRAGFRVIREVGGHGVGRAIHEEPHVANFDDPAARGRLHAGLVLAIEPIVTSGDGRLYEAADGWTLRTADRAPVAHAEHTLVVTRGAPIVVTA